MIIHLEVLSSVKPYRTSPSPQGTWYDMEPVKQSFHHLLLLYEVHHWYASFYIFARIEAIFSFSIYVEQHSNHVVADVLPDMRHIQITMQ